jgi:hypothetical protein
MVGVFGPSPIIFHLTSLVVHLVNVALLFHLIQRLEEPGGCVVNRQLVRCFPLSSRSLPALLG